MTDTEFATFSVCLRFLPHGTAPEWDKPCAKFYFAVLCDIPGDAVPFLMRAVGAGFKFRPTPSEILDTYAKISGLPSPPCAEEIADKMMRLRREKGQFMAPVEGGDRNIIFSVEPPWTDPICARVSEKIGGWRLFCLDNDPPMILRARLTRVAVSVLSDETDTVIGRLRQEYQSAHVPSVSHFPALPAPDNDASDEYPGNDGDEPGALS